MLKYSYKIYSPADAFLGILNPEKVASDASFSARDGGQGQLRLSYISPFDDYDITLITGGNLIRVYEISEAIPLGRLLYTGFISQVSPFSRNGVQGITVTCLGLVSLLKKIYYDSAKLVATLDDTQVEDSDITYAANFVDDLLNKIAWTKAKKISGSSTKVGTMSFSSNVDYTVFEDGSASTTGDYIEISVFLSGTKPTSNIAIEFSTSNTGSDIDTNEFERSILSEISSGWNIIRILKSAFSIFGSPNWNSLGYIRLFYTGGASDTVITYQNLRLLKATNDRSYSGVDVAQIFRDAIDNFNNRYSSNLLSYDGTSLPDTGNLVTVSFSGKKIYDMIDDAFDLVPDGYFWRIDTDGKVYLQAYPATATYRFVIDREVSALNAKKDYEKIINRLIVNGDGVSGIYEDIQSQADFGLREVIEISEIDDQGTLDDYGNGKVANNKELKLSVTIDVLAKKFDIGLVKIGDTCRVNNYKKDSEVFGTNMKIKRLDYTKEVLRIYIDEILFYGETMQKFIDEQ